MKKSHSWQGLVALRAQNRCPTLIFVKRKTCRGCDDFSTTAGTRISRELQSLGLTSFLALQADPVFGARLLLAECRRHHRHAASGTNRRALVIHVNQYGAVKAPNRVPDQSPVGRCHDGPVPGVKLGDEDVGTRALDRSVGG